MVQKAVAARPQSGAMLDSLGWAYYRLGDYKTAVEKLEAAVKAVVEQEDYKEALLKMGVAPLFATGKEITESIEANTPRWQKVIEATREAAN